jgi:aldehyde:ferredoxin oxidoreductase
MLYGYMGHSLWVDLRLGSIRTEPLDVQLARDFIGGYGIGARVLYAHLRPGIDPLGPDNILGFLTGPMTGTPCIEGNRSVVVCKSPLTGGWGDANCGGTFGRGLKIAGFDAIYFTGAAETPVYLLVEDGRAEIRDASELWGLDTTQTEDWLKARHGKNAAVASIGPAGEKLNLISCIINDYGRAWGRSGVGAVMGSKRVKAVVVVGSGVVPLADAPAASKLRKQALKRHVGAYELFKDYGTPGIAADSALSGDSPVKNWHGAGTVDFGEAKTAFDADRMRAAYEDRKYGCWMCSLACGGHWSVKHGQFGGTRQHQPEYESLSSFGSMLLNADVGSIIKANAICNQMGLDSISAGAVIAWAMDCFSRGVLTLDDTDGIELTWGNAAAMLTALERMALREGAFGNLLADGVKRAAERLGRGSEVWAIHIGGQELPMHDPRFDPNFALTYQLDATPGRHTQGTGPWPDMADVPDKYDYSAKGEFHRKVVAAMHFINAIGVCMFGFMSYPIDIWPSFYSVITGRKLDLEDALVAGERIGNLRLAFNLREGINPLRMHLPELVVGVPPLEAGNVRGVTIDVQRQIDDYLKAADWDPVTCAPSQAKLEALGLEFLVGKLYSTNLTF